MKSRAIYALGGLGIAMLASLAIAGGTVGSPSTWQGLGSWEGTGVSYDAQGRERAAFTVSLTQTQPAPGQVSVDGVITFASGQQVPIRQRLVGGPTGFSVTTAQGSGGGRCFGPDLCIVYEGVGSGRGFASTLIFDGTSGLRVLTTELQGETAVGFTRQDLTRK